MPSPIPIALIGSGIFAKEEHLPAILAAPNLRLVAVYSRSLTSAKGLASGLSAKESEAVDLYSEDQDGKGFDALLQRQDIKGVIVALPILTQPDYIRRALTSGKHVLAEKPIAKDVSTAKALLDFATSTPHPNAATFCIAENFRFLDSFQYASDTIASLGRVLNFRVRVDNMVMPGGKYFETAWRKVPEYQGGFLLDGGVHFLAATRLLLAKESLVRTSAFTAQLQEHLPPVDTVHAVVQLGSGVSGTVEISFGTTFTGSEYSVACEKGTVSVSRGKVTITRGKDVEVKDHPDEGNGVKQEVKAWAEGLQKGEMDRRQAPEEALKDLVLLEGMLNSGEKGGAPVELDL
ncbi:NAD(P)-binding protein [Pleomassaria siparia CBS 279.74]|uniref:NAD(P)-binding protein n=1 Tax=Pleomassaria siparia CBS 279.74 TaxID=1314801 RepID=A0A6G1JZ23_9PLEO|nr:NAD(P)-binding protein [Pleomassaria siparia CBS 279.74]